MKHTPECVPPDEVGARGYCVCPEESDEDERSDGEVAEDIELDELQGDLENDGDVQADRLAMFRREY